MTEQERKEREKLVQEVYIDFERVQRERKSLERAWQLDLNFLKGNQYCDVNALGEIEGEDADYFWQQRRVFNMIAPTVDERLSKLSRIRPKLAVREASEDENDKRSAKLASALLSSAYEDCELDEALSRATAWSEACGTVFYKAVWDSSAGAIIGRTAEGVNLREGAVEIIPVSPFEIYPFSLSEESLENQTGIIHARAVPADDIYAAYGVSVAGRDIEDSAYSAPASSRTAFSYGARSVMHGCEVVVERYLRPDRNNPNGRLTVVAGGELLYDGELPYMNGDGGTRTYPFVRQSCIPSAGSFFGTSIVDRLIPVQRAYNAVKNRKHEFLNRISMGTIAVEEGSVDLDELAEDGLKPGKILVYRQGGTPPSMLTLGAVPAEFTEEEERLEESFERISGTSDVTRDSGALTSVTSATGLRILIEQDEARLNVSYDQIKSALKKIGKFVLRLYRQFASSVRLLRYSDGGKLSVTSFRGSDLSSDDVVLEADSEINLSPAERRSAVYEMLDKGLLADENGKISATVKDKILGLLGYNGFGGTRDNDKLHRARCAEENAVMMSGGTVRVKDYDDHAVHIEEHTACLLSGKLAPEREEIIIAHMNEHKNKISEVRKNG